MALKNAEPKQDGQRAQALAFRNFLVSNELGEEVFLDDAENDHFDRYVRQNGKTAQSKHFLLEPFILPAQLQFVSSQGFDLSDPEEMNALQAAIQAVNDEENSANSHQLDLSGISSEIKTRAWAKHFVKNVSKVIISTILLSTCIGYLEV